MAVLEQNVDSVCVNTLRTLAIDAVQQAVSGHPGLPMGAAPMAYALWQHVLQHDPRAPKWADRDRFVLSAGHGSMLLYALLHVYGYDLPLDELKRFRQWHSKTPGHPESADTVGVEATTGPLGQGTANAVGMAIAERALAAAFNRPGHTLVDHYTYALVSDGDLMEGISAEAASLAGHLGLSKLVYLYDSNSISLDGPTSLCFSTEDVSSRYRAYGWHVQEVRDGDTDVRGIVKALEAARAQASKPSLIVVKTTIGYGAPNRQGTSEAHGAPLGAAEVALAKERLGFDPKLQFHIPAAAAAHFRQASERGGQAHVQWRAKFAAYEKEFPELAKEFQRRMQGRMPADFSAKAAAALPRQAVGSAAATRDSGGKAENALAAIVPELMGGDADLSSSTKTSIAGSPNFDGRAGTGRNLRFGVREHAMGAIGNGILYHGGLRPFVSTFFVFSDYMRPAVRIAALAKLPLICVWTHDSVAVGEDGPTHQPVEHLAALRAMPNLHVFRPADANETNWSWKYALESQSTPCALVLSRQKLSVVDGSPERSEQGVARGAYVLQEASGAGPQIILIATGSEVELAAKARAELERAGMRTRLVSMPCWSLFAAQDRAWQDSVLPPKVHARVSVEAGSTFGWQRWTGDGGVALGLDRFGASAPGEVVLAKLGFTVENIVATAKACLACQTTGESGAR